MTIMAEKTKPTGRRKFTEIRGFEEIVLLIILGAVIAIMNVITGGKSIAPANMRHVLVQSAGRGVAAIGQAFVMLTRGIDVSTAGIAFASSALGATMMTTQPWQNIFGETPAPVYAGTPAMLGDPGLRRGASYSVFVFPGGSGPQVLCAKAELAGD